MAGAEVVGVPAAAATADGEPARRARLWREYLAAPDTHPQIPNVSYAGYHRGEDRLPRPRVHTTVTRFGAAGDGIVDCAAAINAAVDAAGRAWRSAASRAMRAGWTTGICRRSPPRCGGHPARPSCRPAGVPGRRARPAPSRQPAGQQPAAPPGRRRARRQCLPMGDRGPPAASGEISEWPLAENFRSFRFPVRNARVERDAVVLAQPLRTDLRAAWAPRFVTPGQVVSAPAPPTTASTPRASARNVWSNGIMEGAFDSHKALPFDSVFVRGDDLTRPATAHSR